MKRTFKQKVRAASKEIISSITNPKLNLKMKSRHLNHLLVRRITRQKRITGLEIQHTFICNARCSFCSMWDVANNIPALDPILFDRILEEAKKEGCILFVFLGGESLLDRNLFSYLDKCWEAGIKAQIQSNGTMLTEENLLKLKEAHVFNISVTLHGSTAEEHDAVYKVPGAFDRLMHAIDFCKKIGLNISMKNIYTKQNEKDGSFQRMLDMCKGKDLPLNVNPFMPVGNAFSDGERLDDAHKQKFRTIALTEPCVSSHVFTDNEQRGCFAGKDYFCITPDGEILPCYFMPLTVGNIKVMSLREAHEIALKIPIFAERLPICVVAESESFYQKCLKPLHEKYPKLPVNIIEHPEVLDILKSFDMSNL